MQMKIDGLFLAPLAGITETVFRRLCKTHGADTLVSEMASAEGLLRAGKQTLRLLAFDKSERPFGVQLFGSDPERMAAAAQLVEAQVAPDFINLNSGCPVPKVVSRQSGAALLKDPARFERIVTAMVKAVKIPVTVKLRSGYNTGEWVDEEFARIAEGSGAHSVILHPRSKAMRYTGHSLWERIAIVKKAVKIPVIGNGDIVSGQDAARMLAETGCDGLMIGRGALGNPWLFREIKQAIAGVPVTPVSPDERMSTILSHIAAYRDRHGERLAGKEMRKHVAWYLRGQTNAAIYRDRVFRSHGTGELEQIVRDVFAMTPVLT
jgi:nifR3 family TIM-barrel protein